MKHRYEIWTMIESYFVIIPCTSEMMARNLLDHFAKIEPQATVCRDLKKKLSIVAFFD